MTELNTENNTELILWVGGPCVITFGLIWFATCLAPAKTTKPEPKRPIVRRNSGHPFFNRTGLLDGGTPYLKSWTTNVVSVNYVNNHLTHNGYVEFDSSSSALQTSMFRGWYNIAMLCILSYILLTFLNNYSNTGQLFANTLFLWSLVVEIHELIIVILLVYFASFSVFFTQLFAAYFSSHLLKLIDKSKNNLKVNKLKINTEIQSLIRQTQWIRLYFTFCSYICILIVLLTTSLFLFYKTKHWPYTQKACLILETVCLTLKSHSYLDTNNELFAIKLSQIQTNKIKEIIDNKLPDITKVKDINNLTDTEIESYLIAYGLKRNILFVSDKRQQKKILIKIREQLILRNTIYPNNVTLWDFLLFTCSPTLCYSPIYPRTGTNNSMHAEYTKLLANIEWIYVMEKFIMALGIIVCMYLIAEHSVIPILSKSNQINFVDAVVRLYFPFFILFILGFFLVFDCILNASAELTCFADRQFYSDWWNATSFMQFSRKWNVPVHEYLLRHIYLGIFIKQLKCSPEIAKAFTFIFSTIFHELVLTTTTHRFKPWFSFFSMWQIPLMPVMRSPMFKNTQLGNIVTLAPFILGISMIAILYAKDYIYL